MVGTNSLTLAGIVNCTACVGALGVKHGASAVIVVVIETGFDVIVIVVVFVYYCPKEGN